MRRLIQILALVLAWSAGGSLAAEPLSIFVSVLPQKHFVERIAGDHARVQVLVGPGESPATFEPRPKQMAGLARADLFYRIGVPFEDVWMERILANSPELAVLDAREGIELREMEPAGGHHHDYDHAHSEENGQDPHVWLNPALVREMGRRLRDRLSLMAPQHGDQFAGNFRRFESELLQLEEEIRGRLSGLSSRKFMVFHPSWGYFADAFDLRQIPIESEGKEPGARTLQRLVAQARSEGVRAVFVQRQFSQDQARALAKAIGASVVSIDPLAEDYIPNLRRVAEAIAGGGR
jgi:zinc transport system substrate-binding protein